MGVMRYRLPPPVLPFDLTPTHLVEAAKRIFILWWLMPQAAVDENRICATQAVPPLGDS
jgi:hypothetical protein